MKIIIFLIGCTLLILSSWSHAAGKFIRIHESFTLIDSIRPGISEEGDVVAAASQILYVGGGGASSVAEVDLSTGGFLFRGTNETPAIHIRNGRELAFVASKQVETCSDFAGVYRRLNSSSTITTLLEGCRSDSTSDSPRISHRIDISANGRIVVPTTFEFVLVGDSIGPLNNPLVGTPVRYLRIGSVAINNSGQIALQSEFAESRRIIFFNDSSNLGRHEEIARFSISNDPIIAINSEGTIIFSINDEFTASVGGVSTLFPPGVYLSELVEGLIERRVTAVADRSSGFCHFGAVTINDSGHYAFSAQLNDGLSSCIGGSNRDGIFKGSNPIEDALILRGDLDLESHQFFDSVTLGYLNNNDELSFITSYSEPLVSPIFLWKANLGEVFRPSSLMIRFIIQFIEIWQKIVDWLKRF